MSGLTPEEEMAAVGRTRSAAILAGHSPAGPRPVSAIDADIAELQRRIASLEHERCRAVEAERRRQAERARQDDTDAAVLRRLEYGDDLAARVTGAWWVCLGEMVERADERETAAAERLHQCGLVDVVRRSVPAVGLQVTIYTASAL